MQVAILAGGLATRLGPLTKETPKSLINIRGKPFLQYQLEFLKKGGVEDVVLCIGHLGENIGKYFGDGREFGINIKYSYDGDKLLGTAGALKNAERLLEDGFIVMYGDSYLFLDFPAVVSFFRKFDKLGLMVVYKNTDRYDKSNVVIDGNLVREYNKKMGTKDMVYIDYGASILRKEALKLVPRSQPYSLEKLFSQLIDRKQLLAYEVGRRFYQIGSLEGLHEFERYISGKARQ
jgi:N-acetyl-alpha-D-muramate 1-phosphate uridylyltransferase